jgi:hypothetical protein
MSDVEAALAKGDAGGGMVAAEEHKLGKLIAPPCVHTDFLALEWVRVSAPPTCHL